MKPGPVFAWILVALDVCAALGYALDRDWRMVIYWAAAAVLTASVTWPR